MSDIESSVWSETAASNNAAAPNGWPEGMAPSAVNDAARETHAAIKRDWNRSHTTITSTGTSTAYVLTYTTAPSAYVNGQRFSFKVDEDCGADATANVNSLGAKTIKKMTSAGLVNLIAGDLQADHHAELEYDSGADALVLMSPNAVTPAGGSITLAMLANAAKLESFVLQVVPPGVALATGVSVNFFPMPYNFTLTNVYANVAIAQASGSILTFDINEGGTSILSTKLTIDNGEVASSTAATPAVISDTALAASSYIRVDIDQIGNGTANGLWITLVGYQT